MEIKAPLASESGHWYAKDGTPAYTVIGKNGKERNTTLRDARTNGYVPSVTGILKLLAAPGLEQWKQKNILMAALTLPKIEGESLDDFAIRVEQDAREQSLKAMELGTHIHTSLERAYQGESFEPSHEPFCRATMTAIQDHFGIANWSAEKSFSSPLGFGGKVDLHSKESNIIIDFKTSAFDDASKKEGYLENRLQLAAYRIGLDLSPNYRAANIFVSTSVPGLVKIVEWNSEEMKEAELIFLKLVEIWQLIKAYKP